MPLFGPAHLIIIALIAAAAFGAARFTSRSSRDAASMRLCLGYGLAANELIWWVFRYSHEGFRFPEGLPLQLCDAAVWVAVFACLRRSRLAVEFAYFAGLAASAMAVLTPDLWAPFPSYPSIYFFLAHGGVIVAAVALVSDAEVEITRASLLRAFALLNVYGAAVGAFNAVFGTNYMYLCRKPSNASLLDLFGSWPLYLAVSDVVAMALFVLLWLPLRGRDRLRARAAAARSARF